MDITSDGSSQTKSEPTSQTKVENAFVASPYDFRTSSIEMKLDTQPKAEVSVTAQMKQPSPKRNPNCDKGTNLCKTTKQRIEVIPVGIPAKYSCASKTEIKNATDPTEDFAKEESKILSIVGSQSTTVQAFAAMNSYIDGDAVISIRELSTWLPINFPKLNNTEAMKLAIRNSTHLQVKNEEKSGSKDILLAKIGHPLNEDRKSDLEIDEIPSFLENLLAYHRIAKLVFRIDPSGELKLTKLEVFLFLKAIKMASTTEVAKGLIAKISKSGSVSFPELCRISFDLGFTSLEIRNANNDLACAWNFTFEMPKPRAPPKRRIKSHNEVRSEMHSKIVSQTRSQDAMASSILPYMVKSRLRAIKQRQREASHCFDELSSSSFQTVVGSMDAACQETSRPNSAGHINSLWKRGNTPRQIISQKIPFSKDIESSLISRTQRSFEQGSILDSRRQSPLFIDTQNGQSIYDIPILSSREYMKHCPIGQVAFKRIVEQQEVNPLAFTTSRTPRLYGVHTQTPGIVRRDFDCSSQTEAFFHNADFNIRRQYRPCTAAKLQTSKNEMANTNNLQKSSWCFGAVPWNGKSTELPKYSGDIGFFEPNQFKKRFDAESIQMWSGTPHSGHLLNTTKIKMAKLNIT